VQFSVRLDGATKSLQSILQGPLGGAVADTASFEVKAKVPTGKIACCEQDNGNMDPVVSLQMTAVGQLQSKPIPIPNLSVKLPLFDDTFLGMYGQFKFYLQGDLTVTHDQCKKDNGTGGWLISGGDVKVIGYEDVGIQAVVQGPGTPKRNR
jgi:hypothetical protein